MVAFLVAVSGFEKYFPWPFPGGFHVNPTKVTALAFT